MKSTFLEFNQGETSNHSKKKKKQEEEITDRYAMKWKQI